MIKRRNKKIYQNCKTQGQLLYWAVQSSHILIKYPQVCQECAAKKKNLTIFWEECQAKNFLAHSNRDYIFN